MKISDVMTRDVQTIRPDQSAQDAARFMLKSEDTGVVRWAVEIFNQKGELVATYDLLTENVP